MRLDDITSRVIRNLTVRLQQDRSQLNWNTRSLMAAGPQHRIRKLHVQLQQTLHDHLNSMKLIVAKHHGTFRELTSRLQALSPLAILSRGYSITRTVPDGAVIRHAEDVHIGQDVEILLATGALTCEVKRTMTDGKTDI